MSLNPASRSALLLMSLGAILATGCGNSNQEPIAAPSESVLEVDTTLRSGDPDASQTQTFQTQTSEPEAEAPGNNTGLTDNAELTDNAAVTEREIAWRDCGSYQCGSVELPIDYANPEGPSFTVAVGKAPASGSQSSRRGTIFVNFGGPGGHGASLAGGYRLPGGLGEVFDLVTWDPRGVEGSAGMACADTIPDEPNTRPDSSDGYGDELAVAIEVWDAVMTCAARSPLIDNIGTADNARDLDVLRRAVGDAELHYLGYSYGTELGWVYASLFPESVGPMVLDGAVPPGTFSVEGELERYPVFDEAFLRLDQGCENTDCVLAEEGMAETVQRLFAELEAAPIALPDGTAFGPIDLVTVLAGSSYYDPSVIGPIMSSWISSLDAGDASGAANFVESLNNGFEPAVFWSVICADGVGVHDSAEALAAYGQMAESAPLTVGLAPDVAFCHRFPGATPGLPTLDTSDAGPILVIGNTGDPATPYEWAVELDELLADSVLLTYHGGGHTISSSNTCIDGYVADYFTSRRLPPAGSACGLLPGSAANGWTVPIDD